MKAHTRTTAVLVVLALALAGCSDGSSSNAAAPAPPVSTAQTGLRLVALGDSDTTGAGDAEGKGWVQRYADLVEAATGRNIEVRNLAMDGLTSAALADQVESQQLVRDELASADIVVVGAGGADLNAGDDAWEAGRCSGPSCYTAVLAAYKANIARTAAAVAAIRSGAPTVFRAITLPNGLTGAESVIPRFIRRAATEVGTFQARSNRNSTCAAVRAHGGDCVDVLTAFNGPDGSKDAYASGLMNLVDCCYPSGQGQQRMAELLLATGTQARALT